MVALEKVAKELGTSLAVLAVAWTIRNPNVSSTILGATKEAQLTETLKAIDVYQQLTPEIMKEIDTIMGNVPTAIRH